MHFPLNADSIKRELSSKNLNKTPLSLWILENHELIKNQMECKIELSAKLSAKKIQIEWSLPQNLPAPIEHFALNLTIILSELEGGHGQMAESFDSGFPLNLMAIPPQINSIGFEAIPGSQYCILMEMLWKGTNAILCRNGLTTRATFSIHEMELLHKKAIEFIGHSQMHSFQDFYRSKPEKYWNKIRSTPGQIMAVYPKDSNGQAASPINQNIQGEYYFFLKAIPQGLFFNAFSFVPSESSVGNQLLTIPALDLLNSEKNNLYFADFYCNRQNSKHYVTIVVTENASETDKFCQAHLIPLDPFDNPFLKFRQTTPDSPKVELRKCKANGLWLEIFYTENIPIGKYLENIQQINAEGNGISLFRGVAHFKNCQICNIYLDLNQNEINFDKNLAE